MSNVRLKSGSSTVEITVCLVRAVACQRCQLSELLPDLVIIQNNRFTQPPIVRLTREEMQCPPGQQTLTLFSNSTE